MTAFDHYGAAERLIVTLNQAGLVNDAVALQNAIDGGSTGTEIFMALSFNLKQLLGRSLREDIRANAVELMDEIEKALKARD
jgi:hypothetical protein